MAGERAMTLTDTVNTLFFPHKTAFLQSMQAAEDIAGLDAVLRRAEKFYPGMMIAPAEPGVTLPAKDKSGLGKIRQLAENRALGFILREDGLWDSYEQITGLATDVGLTTAFVWSSGRETSPMMTGIEHWMAAEHSMRDLAAKIRAGSLPPKLLEIAPSLAELAKAIEKLGPVNWEALQKRNILDEYTDLAERLGTVMTEITAYADQNFTQRYPAIASRLKGRVVSAPVPSAAPEEVLSAFLSGLSLNKA
jgi:hypothetical protein